MRTLDELYQHVASTPGDIWEHVPTLGRLATGRDHVTEFGTRYGISTVALLSGRPKRMVAYDVERHEAVHEIECAARGAGVTFEFVQANTLCVAIEETDLLFIDTLHTYEQLTQELSLHGSKVRKYIVLHDTVSFGQHGEIPGTEGLLRATQEYFDCRPEWVLTEDHPNNNGLRVYERK